MEFTTDFEILEQEREDIAFVRQRCKSSHVQDADALTSFNDGRGVFDVDAHAIKLDTFIARHQLEGRVRRIKDGSMPAINALINHRPIHFAFKEN